jgi:hypothetical protein
MAIMARAFTFNGTDFSQYGITVTRDFSENWPGMTGNPIKAVGSTGSQRVFMEGGAAQPIEITFPVRMAADSKEDLQDNIDAISTALRTVSDAALVVDWLYTDRYYMARWNNAPIRYKWKNPTTVYFDIGFIAQPYLVSTTSVSGYAAINQNPMEIWIPGPNQNSGVVTGNALCLPLWKIKNTGSAISAESLEIWNYHTGDVARWTDTFAQDTYFQYDCDTLLVESSSDGTTWTECFGKLTGSRMFTPLQGGIANKIIVIGCTSGILYWTYRGRYY